jgi:inosine/xanthosine triphosphate pyrophosphatase family protein
MELSHLEEMNVKRINKLDAFSLSKIYTFGNTKVSQKIKKHPDKESTFGKKKERADKEIYTDYIIFDNSMLEVKVRFKKSPDIIAKCWRKNELYRNLGNKRVKKRLDETNKKDANFVMKQLGFGKQMIKHMLTEELLDLIKTGDDN